LDAQQHCLRKPEHFDRQHHWKAGWQQHWEHFEGQQQHQKTDWQHFEGQQQYQKPDWQQHLECFKGQ